MTVHKRLVNKSIRVGKNSHIEEEMERECIFLASVVCPRKLAFHDTWKCGNLSSASSTDSLRLLLISQVSTAK